MIGVRKFIIHLVIPVAVIFTCFLSMSFVNAQDEQDVTDFQITMFSSHAKYYLTPNPTFIVEIENTGSRDFVPRGAIELTDPFGTVQAYTLRVNDGMKTIRPGEKYSETLSWNDKTVSKILPPIGRYKANLELYDSFDHDAENTANTTFTVVPLQYIGVLIIFADIFIVFAVIQVRRWISLRNFKPGPKTVVIFRKSKKSKAKK